MSMQILLMLNVVTEVKPSIALSDLEVDLNSYFRHEEIEGRPIGFTHHGSLLDSIARSYISLETEHNSVVQEILEWSFRQLEQEEEFMNKSRELILEMAQRLHDYVPQKMGWNKYQPQNGSCQ
ncbi:hypothetical protein HY404_00480 [Candidatus Microgenomates bacterium]|nr:hypothetical protein [Candidatus Microgenomates bacterium]